MVTPCLDEHAWFPSLLGTREGFEAEYPYHSDMLLPKRLFGLSRWCLEGS